eukprot:scaffold2.g7345.t1
MATSFASTRGLHTQRGALCGRPQQQPRHELPAQRHTRRGRAPACAAKQAAGADKQQSADDIPKLVDPEAKFRTYGKHFGKWPKFLEDAPRVRVRSAADKARSQLADLAVVNERLSGSDDTEAAEIRNRLEFLRRRRRNWELVYQVVTRQEALCTLEAIEEANRKVEELLRRGAGEESRESNSMGNLKRQLLDLQGEVGLAHQRLHATQARVEQNLRRINELKAEASKLERMQQGLTSGKQAATPAAAVTAATVAAAPAAAAAGAPAAGRPRPACGGTGPSGAPLAPAVAATAAAADAVAVPAGAAGDGTAAVPGAGKQLRPRQRGLAASLELEEELRNNWFIVHFSSKLGKDTMVPFELFGQAWVLFRDAEGRPACVRDECAHRACPLSLGRVADGQVECPYHGWRFNGDGVVTAMPSTTFCKGVAVSSLPCLEADGFVWVWPGWEQPAELPDFARPPEGYTVHAEIELEVPVEHGLLVENLLDLAHAPFTHTTTFARGWPVPDMVRFQATKLLSGKWDPYPIDMYFHPPCVTVSSIGLARPGVVLDGDSAAECRTHLHQMHICLPARRGHTRLLYRMCMDFMNWVKYVPGIESFWRKIAGQVLGEDLVLVRGQQDRLRRGGDTWRNPVSYDMLGVRYRRWRNSLRPAGARSDDEELDGLPTVDADEDVYVDMEAILIGDVEPEASTSSQGSQAPVSPAELRAFDTDDDTLYRDLVQRANGDHDRVSHWLALMGYRPEDFASIPAIGSKLRLGDAPAGGAARPGADPLEPTSKRGLESLDGGADKLGLKDKEAASDPDVRAADAGAPRHFFCPISTLIMRDPVVLVTGQTYDRPCIEQWLGQNSSCPVTGQALAPPVHLTPNVALRNAIEEWCEKHAPYMLDAARHLQPVPADVLGSAPVRKQQLQPPGQGQAGGAPGPARPGPATGSLVSGVQDPGLALAIRMQQQELARLAEARTAAALARPQLSRGRWSGSGGRSHSGSAWGQRGPPARRPWRSWTAVQMLLLWGAYLALFLLAMAKAGWQFESFQLNPFGGPPQDALLAVGALSAAALTDQHQWWRLASSPFVDAGIIQLVGNLGTLWSFGRYLDGVLPVPALSLPAIYLGGAFLGAATSANLNLDYLACGASAGICALLGGVWADQAVNGGRYRSRWVMLLTLLLVTGVFAAISLLPLLNIWFNMAGLVAGLLLGLLLLTLPRTLGGARRGGGGRRWLVLLQLACAGLLAAWAALAGVGLAEGGQTADVAFFHDSSCLRLRWWSCVEADMTPNGCRWDATSNGTTTMQCPSVRVWGSGGGGSVPAGQVVAVPSDGSDWQALIDICDAYCGSGTAPAASSRPPVRDNWGADASPPTSPAGHGSRPPTPSLARAPSPPVVPGAKLYSISGGR